MSKYILLVDDEPGLVRVTARVLRRAIVGEGEKYQLIGCEHPTELVNKVRAVAQPEDRFFLITDGYMPIMSGDILIQKLRQLLRERLISVIIASSSEDFGHAAREMHADFIHGKVTDPIYWPKVQAMIEHFLEQP